MKKYSIPAILILMLAAACISCSRYYKVNVAQSKLDNKSPDRIAAMAAKARVFILRSGENVYLMENVSLDSSKTRINATLTDANPDHLHHAVKGKKGKRTYARNRPHEVSVLNELHFYIDPDPAINFGAYALDLSRVTKMEVLEKNKEATITSYILGAVVGIGIVVAIVVALKSSCPFVSGYNGDEYTLQGEIFSGAIFPQLVRDDHLPLHLEPDKSGFLKVQISNELQEVQYTDLARLQVITHEPNNTIVPGLSGDLYSVMDPEAPLSARTGDGEFVSGPLKYEDDGSVVQMTDSNSTDGTSQINLLFKKPAADSEGRLLVRLKNSYFLDVLYGELVKGMGTYYSTYVSQQKQKTRESLVEWLAQQNIPLKVEVETPHGWQQQALVTTVGPLANRTIAIPLAVAPGQEMVNIRITSGFMFWEIDYAAMDYSKQGTLGVDDLLPLTARNEMGENVRDLLTNADNSFLVQPEVGNNTVITYKHKPVEGMRQTYILHTRGYYEHIREFNHPPDMKFLSRFTQPNSFSLFSRESYYNKLRDKEAFAAFIAGEN